MKIPVGNDFYEYRKNRLNLWNRVAVKSDRWRGLGGTYHKRISQIYRFLIPENQRVVELGCARGDLLASLKPRKGIGVDFSQEMIRRAEKKHTDLSFVCADAHRYEQPEPFDFVVLSDLVNDIYDVQTVLEQIKKYSTEKTRIVLNTYSRLWELPLSIARALGLGKKNLEQNWMMPHDLTGIFNLAGFEVVRCWQEVLLPLPLPIISWLLNKFIVKMWPFNHLAMTHFMIARPKPEKIPADKKPSVSVIVAARNEEGNIENIIQRTPQMGSGTELIFVEGNSTDDTYGEILRRIKDYPEMNCKALQQSGKGKGDAVRKGFDNATGDILMILDADLTVPPERLPRFYDALCSGEAEFANGVRLVYPMADRAMRFFNLIGNKFFALAFSWLLGQPIKDTLCGTKVLWKKDYEKICENRKYFGEFDPFGDFDLIFGAAKLNLKILDIPIRYGERTYGDTNIQRWRHGVLLLRMVLFACRRIKFI